MDLSRLREIVERAIERELSPGVPLPHPDEDVVDCGALDSMGWVSAIRSIESATGSANFGDRLTDGQRSINAILAVLPAPVEKSPTAVRNRARTSAGGKACIFGWAAAVGSQSVDVSTVEREFELPAGRLRKNAGLESVARLPEGEDELDFYARVGESALGAAKTEVGEVDCLIAVSETFTGYPSLAASLHSRLLADETCAAFDVGGACVGLLHALHLSGSLIHSGGAGCVLVVAGEAHSRILRPGRVSGDFGGLFGDGACAFILRAAPDDGQLRALRLGSFLFGCSGAFASALRIGLSPDGALALRFEGDALARAAIERLEMVIEDLELQSGRNRDDVSAFAVHQPNPRLLEILARQIRVPIAKFPLVAKHSGNLGAATCGVALCKALAASSTLHGDQRQPVFLAAVGPGMQWGGAVLE